MPKFLSDIQCADRIDDSSSTKKLVTQSEKDTWNAKGSDTTLPLSMFPDVSNGSLYTPSLWNDWRTSVSTTGEELTITAISNDEHDAYYELTEPLIVGHKYVFSAFVDVIKGGFDISFANYRSWQDFDGGRTGEVYQSGFICIDLAVMGLSEPPEAGIVVTLLNSSGEYEYVSASESITLSKIALIDLTEVFGAGNEPSLELFNDNTVTVNQGTAIKLLTSLDESKVDKVEGKGLSTEDYTTEDKNKVAEIDLSLPMLPEVSNGKLYSTYFVWGDLRTSVSTTGEDLTLMASSTGAHYAYYVLKEPLIVGHKYALSAFVDVIKGGFDISFTNAKAVWPDSDESQTGEVYQSGFICIDLAVTELRQPPDASVLVNLLNSSGEYEYVSASESITLSKIALIDLTEVFGAGNEPTSIEMMELVKLVTNGWLGDALILNHKQIITWQLNLIRKILMP